MKINEKIFLGHLLIHWFNSFTHLRFSLLSCSMSFFVVTKKKTPALKKYSNQSLALIFQDYLYGMVGLCRVLLLNKGLRYCKPFPAVPKEKLYFSTVLFHSNLTRCSTHHIRRFKIAVKSVCVPESQLPQHSNGLSRDIRVAASN